MSSHNDLPNLAIALEYADLAAALYLAGGSDHAARLLAAGAEQLLGDLVKLLGHHVESDQVQSLLARVALSYEAPVAEPHSHAQTRERQPSLQRTRSMAALHEDEARSDTAAYLRASWYMLESMGLEAVIPTRLVEAIESTTIVAPLDL